MARSRVVEVYGVLAGQGADEGIHEFEFLRHGGLKPQGLGNLVEEALGILIHVERVARGGASATCRWRCASRTGTARSTRAVRLVVASRHRSGLPP